MEYGLVLVKFFFNPTSPIDRKSSVQDPIQARHEGVYMVLFNDKRRNKAQDILLDTVYQESFLQTCIDNGPPFCFELHPHKQALATNVHNRFMPVFQP